MSDRVEALTGFDQCGAPAPCPALYAGGFFITADGVLANFIAKWAAVGP